MTKHKETKKRPKCSDPSGSRGETKKRSGHIIKGLLLISLLLYDHFELSQVGSDGKLFGPRLWCRGLAALFP